MTLYSRTADTKANQLRIVLTQILLVVLHAGLISIAFLDHERYYFAWLAYVPILFATRNASFTRTYLLGFVAGILSFASGTYWIFDFIVISKGSNTVLSLALASLVWLYCAQQLALVLILFKWLKKHSGVHEFLLFPIVVASFTSAFPMLFAMRLGESQINFYSALQATEFVGVHGLDAIIALANILVFRLLYQLFYAHPSTTKDSKWPWAIAVSIISAWFGYGITSFKYWESEQTTWDTNTVGIVQSHEIPWLGKNTTYPGFSRAYPPEMAMTERLARQGAEIIIWPEAQNKDYLNNSRISSAYQKNIAALDSSLLFQDTEQIRNPSNGQLIRQYNTAILLNDNGKQTGSYQKLKRIPFGEYLPIIHEDSMLGRKAKVFLGDFLNEISKGSKHQVFTHDKANIIPLICYETTYPSFVGEAVRESASRTDNAKGSILVALSNDGWFGSTHQSYQHIMASVLRAVENRLPLIHVANNGPSIVVSPSGRVTFTSDFQQAGGYLTKVALSHTAQGSFYSRHPRLFDRFLYITLLFSGILAVRSLLSGRLGLSKRKPSPGSNAQN